MEIKGLTNLFAILCLILLTRGQYIYNLWGSGYLSYRNPTPRYYYFLPDPNMVIAQIQQSMKDSRPIPINTAPTQPVKQNQTENPVGNNATNLVSGPKDNIQVTPDAIKIAVSINRTQPQGGNQTKPTVSTVPTGPVKNQSKIDTNSTKTQTPTPTPITIPTPIPIPTSTSTPEPIKPTPTPINQPISPSPSQLVNQQLTQIPKTGTVKIVNISQPFTSIKDNGSQGGDLVQSILDQARRQANPKAASIAPDNSSAVLLERQNSKNIVDTAIAKGNTVPIRIVDVPPPITVSSNDQRAGASPQSLTTIPTSTPTVTTTISISQPPKQPEQAPKPDQTPSPTTPPLEDLVSKILAQAKLEANPSLRRQPITSIPPSSTTSTP